MLFGTYCAVCDVRTKEPSTANVISFGENGVGWLPGPALPPGAAAPTPPISETYCFPSRLIRDRRAHAAAQAGLDFQQLLALVGAVSEQASVVDHLKHQISRRRDRAAADAAAARHAPAHLLRHRIPGDQRSRGPASPSGSGPIAGGDGTRRRRASAAPCRSSARACGSISRLGIAYVKAVRRRCRNVHQTRRRIEGHRRPVVRAAAAGRNRDRRPSP